MQKRRDYILSEKRQEVKKLTQEVRQLVKDIDVIIDKHNSYRIDGGEQKINEWFDSLPILSLADSCKQERGQLKKFSLHDLRAKYKLRKEHTKKVVALEMLQHKKKIAEIELLIERINRLA